MTSIKLNNHKLDLNRVDCSPYKNLSIYLVNKGTVAETRTVELANYHNIQKNGVWVFMGDDGKPSNTSTSIEKTGNVTVSNNTFEITLSASFYFSGFFWN